MNPNVNIAGMFRKGWKKNPNWWLKYRMCTSAEDRKGSRVVAGGLLIAEGYKYKVLRVGEKKHNHREGKGTLWGGSTPPFSKA